LCLAEDGSKVDPLHVVQSFPFEDLIEDMAKLVVTEFLDKHTTAMMAFTCKKYYNLLISKLPVHFEVNEISKYLGQFGTKDMVKWWLDHKHFFTSLNASIFIKTLLEKAIIYGKLDIITMFKINYVGETHEYFFSYKNRNLPPTSMLLVDYSYYLGQNGDLQFDGELSDLGMEEFVTWKVCEGAALNGHLGMFERYSLLVSSSPSICLFLFFMIEVLLGH